MPTEKLRAVLFLLLLQFLLPQCHFVWPSPHRLTSPWAFCWCAPASLASVCWLMPSSRLSLLNSRVFLSRPIMVSMFLKLQMCFLILFRSHQFKSCQAIRHFESMGRMADFPDCCIFPGVESFPDFGRPRSLAPLSSMRCSKSGGDGIVCLL